MFHLLNLNGLPIFEQLRVEEALLRADDRNWCLFNGGSPAAIVMGISGKYAEHVNPTMMQKQAIPIIRRFSGGGTVIVDENTCFFTLIGNRQLLDFPCYPEALLKWTEQLYAPAFQGINFSLRDNDYVIDQKKFGGNAQYICKHRWLHHSSFLWDFAQEKMDYLLMPNKVPAYRKGRSHAEFLTPLFPYFSSKAELQNKVLAAVKIRYSLLEVPLEEIDHILRKDHRRALQLALPPI